jgi:acyl-CoA thioester hydrolase
VKTGWDFADPFVKDVVVAEADIDELEHTNNTVYIRWCEEIAWEHSISLGVDLGVYHALRRAMVIHRSEFDYLSATFLAEQLRVATWVVGWDEKITMERRFQIVRIKDGKTVFRGLMRFACVDLDSGRPRRMPKAFLEGYGQAITQLDTAGDAG